MKIKLKGDQIEVISSFSNDVAKGLMLAALVGQIVIEGATASVNIINYLGVIVLSLSFLSFAVLLKKKI